MLHFLTLGFKRLNLERSTEATKGGDVGLLPCLSPSGNILVVRGRGIGNTKARENKHMVLPEKTLSQDRKDTRT
jgi:hypothetical protein